MVRFILKKIKQKENFFKDINFSEINQTKFVVSLKISKIHLSLCELNLSIGKNLFIKLNLTYIYLELL